MKRILAFAALAASLAACTKVANEDQSGGRHSWTQAGVLRIAIQSDVKSLNPLLNSNTTDVFINRLMFEPLLTADPKGNPLPMLAVAVPTTQNGGISADGLTITYHLRKDAKWTDGVAVTSKDVKWSWSAIMNPANNVVSRHGYDYVKSVDTPDAATVVVHLKQKFAPFVNTLLRRKRSAVSGRAGTHPLEVSEHQRHSSSTANRTSATDRSASPNGRATTISTSFGTTTSSWANRTWTASRSK